MYIKIRVSGEVKDENVVLKKLHPSKGLYCYIINSRNHKFSIVTVASFVTIAVLANLLFLRGG